MLRMNTRTPQVNQLRVHRLENVELELLPSAVQLNDLAFRRRWHTGKSPLAGGQFPHDKYGDVAAAHPLEHWNL